MKGGPKMTRKMIDLNGLQLAYVDTGIGEPLFLLHGFPDSADVWRRMLPGLVAAGYRVIAPDLRGFGQSAAPVTQSAYQAKYLMQDVLALKASLGFTQPVKLIAHDWGANLGWLLVSLFPQAFQAYVPISVGHPYAYAHDGGFEQQKKGWYAMAFQFEGLAEKLFSQHDWAAFRVFTQDNPELDRHWLPDLRRPGRFTAALNLYRANLGPSDRPLQLAPTPVPIHGFYGADDLYLSQAQMQASGKYVAGSFDYQVVPGGHWLPLEQPELLVQASCAFFANLTQN